MGKYNELTRGQTEALVNKLGGMGAVEAILAGAEAATAFPKEVAYLKSLDRCLAIRDFIRGWGVYSSETSFSFSVNRITDIATNFGEDLVKNELDGSEDECREKLLGHIDSAIIWLTEFRVRDGGGKKNWGFEVIEMILRELKVHMKADDGLKMTIAASKIRGYLNAASTLNDLALSEFDEANEKGKYKRAGK